MGNTIWCTEADKTDIQLSDAIKKYTSGIKTTFKKVEYNENSFVEKYSKYYLSESPKDENCPPYLRQTNRAVEEKIMGIFDNKNWGIEDVFNILAWKTGSIISLKDDGSGEIEYKSNWKCKNGCYYASLPYQSNGVDLFEFLEEVCECKKRYDNNILIDHCDWKKEANRVWNKLVSYINEKNVNGIGPVILLTILFFITKGELPIYDRFAMASLLSFKINNDNSEVLPFGSTIKISTFPDKSNLTNYIINENLYSYYCELLSKYFDGWKNNRNTDRALWVYGHFFKVLQ